MTDEEYVLAVAEALRIEERMLEEGYTQPEIDHFFEDCRQYEVDLATQAMIGEGRHLNDEEIASMWAPLQVMYDGTPDDAYVGGESED